jgi:3-oxoacyl-[acyl-carrier protein] reductase
VTDSVDGKTVLVAGASSESGFAVASALVRAGARVIAVGSRREGMDALAARLASVDTRVCDLSDDDAVAELGESIRDTYESVDGLIHLVGGWRGGGGVLGQSDDDWAFLDRSFATLRVTSREFFDDLVQSPAGRLAIVSSTVVQHPLAGSANYAAAKAAAEAWTLSLAQGFGKAGETAAATIFVVKTLAGLEPRLADLVVGLWNTDALSLNGTRIPLTA